MTPITAVSQDLCCSRKRARPCTAGGRLLSGVIGRRRRRTLVAYLTLRNYPVCPDHSVQRCTVGMVGYYRPSKRICCSHTASSSSTDQGRGRRASLAQLYHQPTSNPHQQFNRSSHLLSRTLPHDSHEWVKRGQELSRSETTANGRRSRTIKVGASKNLRSGDV